MFLISKDFTFSAAHRLDLGEDHPCSRIHGHNYVVRVEIGTELLDNQGMVLDYRDLDDFGRWIDDNLDHRNLNDQNDQPTAEMLARDLWYALEEVLPADPAFTFAVGVSETPKCWAWYRP